MIRADHKGFSLTRSLWSVISKSGGQGEGEEGKMKSGGQKRERERKSRTVFHLYNVDFRPPSCVTYEAAFLH